MSLTFLCPTHRDWVYFHPQEALLYIEEHQNQGETYMQQKDWQQASAFLGCAFETTEILMELQGSQQSFLVSRLTSLALRLSESFNQLKVLNISKQVLLQAEEKLQHAAEKDVGNQARQDFILQCIENIRLYINGYNISSSTEHLPSQTH